MTTEEKAKAYDDALEKAKEHINIKGIGDTVDLCKHLFPQLHDSEDEKIRKFLIKLVNDGLTRFPDSLSKIDVLVYLEKQKDASKAIEAVDRIDKYIDERLANAHDMKDSNPDKKYYRGWDDALGKMAGILQDVYSGEKQKEQKPEERFKEAREKYQVEWSEEDEKMLNSIIGDLFCGTGFNMELKSTASKKVNWLKDKLKSLRSFWKPSEHQMNILKAVKEYVGRGSGYWREGLSSLIEDLEKLI